MISAASRCILVRSSSLARFLKDKRERDYRSVQLSCLFSDVARHNDFLSAEFSSCIVEAVSEVETEAFVKSKILVSLFV